MTAGAPSGQASGVVGAVGQVEFNKNERATTTGAARSWKQEAHRGHKDSGRGGEGPWSPAERTSCAKPPGGCTLHMRAVTSCLSNPRPLPTLRGTPAASFPPIPASRVPGASRASARLRAPPGASTAARRSGRATGAASVTSSTTCRRRRQPPAPPQEGGASPHAAARASRRARPEFVRKSD